MENKSRPGKEWVWEGGGGREVFGKQETQKAVAAASRGGQATTAATRSHWKSFINRKIVAVSGEFRAQHPQKKRKTHTHTHSWEMENGKREMENGLAACQGYLRPVCLFDLSVCDGHKKLSAISIVVQLSSSFPPTYP